MKAKASKRTQIVLQSAATVDRDLYSTIRNIITSARAVVYSTANAALVQAYWHIGREIVEKQGGATRAKYGDGLIKEISSKLTAEFGPGFTTANLRYMRLVYQAFPNRHTLCDKLSWSHYRILATVEKEDERMFYLKECAESGWSVRILERQIASLYYSRLLRHKANPKSLKALIKRESAPVLDIVRSPAILEFSGITSERYQEKDLEKALIKNIRLFLMELGRGFALDAEQKQLKIGDETYSCDLVFYNYIARCFFLIDLKVGKVTPQDIGQMQLYKHFYEREMMNPGDNPPIGIVLGSDTDSAVVKYTLNENERNLFAVKYHLELPTVEELKRELKKERAAIEEALLLQSQPLKPQLPLKPLKPSRS